MRRAFSMVTAIFVILLLATISMLMLNMAATTTNSTVEQHQHEQAALYAKSFTELAIMRAMDATRPITSNGTAAGGYTATSSIQYLPNAANPTNIIINTYITYTTQTNAPITTYFKRTLQKL